MEPQEVQCPAQNRVIFGIRLGFSGICTAGSWKSSKMDTTHHICVFCLTVLMQETYTSRRLWTDDTVYDIPYTVQPFEV